MGDAQILEDSAERSRELELWKRFAGGADAAARAALIELHLPLSRAIAASLYGARGADDVEFSDYMQYATLGLMEAVDAFDWQRGVRFNTFATYRIQGAIRNGLSSFSERREQIGLAVRLKKERMESLREAAAPRPRRQRGKALVREMADIAVVWAL